MFGRKTETYELKKENSKRKRKKKNDPPEEEFTEPVMEEASLSEEEAPAWEEPEEAEEPAEEAPPQGKAGEKKKEKRKKSGLPFFEDKKKVGILLVSLSLFMILVVSPLLNYFTATKMTTAVVAKEDIKQGTPITDELLATVSVPESSMLPIYITGKDEALEKYAKTDIAKNEQLSSVKLSDTLPFENSYLYTLPQNKKALSVTVSSLASGLSGKLQAGDVVSLYVNLNESGQDQGQDQNQNKEKKDYTAKLYGELTFLRVLAVTNVDGLDIEPVGKTEQENALPATITLEVTDTQACILAGMEKNGKFYAALVSRGDEERAAALLKTQEDYLTQQKQLAVENAGNLKPVPQTEVEAQSAIPAELQPPIVLPVPENGGAVK